MDLSCSTLVHPPVDLRIVHFSMAHLTSTLLMWAIIRLDWSLRNDERVTVMERTNFRYVTPEDLTGPVPNFASIDVSFISLRIILPPLLALLKQPADIVALIKPQFEAGREKVGKSGVVRDTKVHKDVLQTMLHFSSQLGLHLQSLTFSPITGGEGNIEFLAHWRLEAPEATQPEIDPASLDALAEQVAKEAGSYIYGKLIIRWVSFRWKGD